MSGVGGSLVRPEALAQLGLLAVTLVLLACGGGHLLQLAFTPLALAVALFLCLRAPTGDYVSFCYWIWMLAPLVRRLADQQSGFQEVSAIIVAPLAVTCVAGLRAARTRFWSFLPFTTIIVVYFYGALVGLLQGELVSVAYVFVHWTAPVVFGCYVLTYASKIDEMAQAIFRTLVLGGFLQALYALDQYVNLRSWDAHWMIASAMPTIGLPFPQSVRVFGTLNSPGPFALFMGATLLAMLSSPSKVKWLAMPPSVAALALSLVRSTWGALFIAFGFLLVVAYGAQRVRHVLLAAAVCVLALPLLYYGPIADTVVSRLATLAAIGSDFSFRDRLEFTEQLLGRIDILLFGLGLGSTGLGSKLGSSVGAVTVFDNGVLEFFFNFGLMAIAVFGALAAMLVQICRSARRSHSAQLSAAIAISVVVQLIFSNSLAGLGGMLFFPFVAIAVLHGAPAKRESPYAQRTAAA